MVPELWQYSEKGHSWDRPTGDVLVLLAYKPSGLLMTCFRVRGRGGERVRLIFIEHHLSWPLYMFHVLFHPYESPVRETVLIIF